MWGGVLSITVKVFVKGILIFEWCHGRVMVNIWEVSMIVNYLEEYTVVIASIVPTHHQLSQKLLHILLVMALELAFARLKNPLEVMWGDARGCYWREG